MEDKNVPALKSAAQQERDSWREAPSGLIGNAVSDIDSISHLSDPSGSVIGELRVEQRGRSYNALIRVSTGNPVAYECTDCQTTFVGMPTLKKPETQEIHDEGGREAIGESSLENYELHCEGCFGKLYAHDAKRQN